ncbi:TraB/GumN family protein [Panacibacter ginsenosidivorans]|uniref:TraB/GumN family protein n=1 Tax=Panacibacter ginsenosidivorans TaxID=1813871 RepID=A0A5B8V682_9BACT|nr:TraB/GumN family protein [Panacibacter ginsenosidivorans]QEC66699.1 TraB/GumN family protein [Panacibacter ginsenosidivorans]
MKKKLLKYTSLLLSFTGLISCQGKSQFATAENNKSLLWEITGPDLQKPSYVFGTMHLLCSNDAKLSTNLQQVITNANEIYFEVDMDDLGQLLTGFTAGTMKHDTTLHQLYTDEEYNRVKTFFDTHGMGMQLQMFSHMQPMLVSALVYQTMLPCAQADGMELSIMQLAHTKKKEIKGLETVAFQASVLDNIPYDKQAKELLNSIDSIETSTKEADEMIKLYKEQDIDKLLEFSLKSDGGTTSDVQDVMIDQRNKNWADQFPNITKDKQILIAVGAGHLGGEKGLLNLLKEKGYTVRAIQN